nr:type IIL restriction-modification enzyme MmeI [Rothia sp. ZJ932]
MHCVITGYTREQDARQRLFEYDWTTHEFGEHKVKTGINAYLLDAPNVLVTKRSKPMSVELPEARFGTKPADNGNLIVEVSDIEEVRQDPISIKYLREYRMGRELVRGLDRWCLWLENVEPADLENSPLLKRRVESNRVWRSQQTPSGDAYKLRDLPHLMRPNKNRPLVEYVGIPRVVSENRKFYTVDLLKADVIAGDKVYTAEDPDGFLFAIISSSMFMAWQRAIGGRLKSDLSFSNTIVWNNLPLPPVEQRLREQIIAAGKGVLAARETIAERTGGTRSLADMYNPLAMDKGLLDAHKKLDRLVDKAFGAPKLCTSETQRLELLFRIAERINSPC